jgi:DNA-binding MarR family transcriptional regulator
MQHLRIPPKHTRCHRPFDHFGLTEQIRSNIWVPMLQQSRSSDEELRAAFDGLRQMVRVLRLSSTEVERTMGIGVAQLFVLERLADGTPRSIGDLAREAFTDPSSVSVVVARLVTRKLVARRADRADGRRARLSITAAGRALVARAPESLQARLLAALRALPSRRVRELASTLGQVAQSVGSEPPMMFEDTLRRKR